MSKSTGNFLTLEEAIKKYSADVTRLVLGIAGDDMSDANFNESEANSLVLKIHNLIDWYEIYLNKELSENTELNYFDKVFNLNINTIINKTLDAFKNMKFREGIIYSFFDLQNIRDKYINYTSDPNQILILKYMKVQLQLLAPIMPHITQYLWKHFSEEPIMIQAFPQYMEEDKNFIKSFDYIEDIINSIRKYNSKKNSKNIKLIISDGYPDWQKDVINIVNKVYDFESNKLDMKKFRNQLPESLLNKKLKDTMQFANYVSSDFKKLNIKQIPVDMPFDEKQILELNIEFLKNKLNIKELKIQVDSLKSQPFRPKIEIF